jgi:hypothetical protein
VKKNDDASAPVDEPQQRHSRRLPPTPLPPPHPDPIIDLAQLIEYFPLDELGAWFETLTPTELLVVNRVLAIARLRRPSPTP